MAHSFSIRDWEKRLQEFGYRKDPQARGAFSKDAGVRKLSVQKSNPRLGSTGHVTVNLDVCHSYMGGWVIILQGSLRRNAPPTASTGGGQLWGPEEGNAALAATVQYGLPWLEEHGAPHKLIEYYETCLREGVKRETLTLPPIFKKMSFGPSPSETVRRPPIYNWYLAELYSEVGDNKKSRRFAEQYLVTLPDNCVYEEERAEVLDFVRRLPHS
jgi:hypothetical protein